MISIKITLSKKNKGWDGYASGNMSSTYAKKEAGIQKKLDKLVEDLSKIGE